MKKKIKSNLAVVSLLLFVLGVTEVSGAVSTTAKSGSSQGYRITARALWEYTTGSYAGKGTHTVNSKPRNTLTLINDSQYVLTHKSSNYNVTQYFQPVY